MNRITTLDHIILRDEGRGKSDTFIYTVPKVNKVKAYCKLGKLEDIMEYFKINSIDQLVNILEAWEEIQKYLILNEKHIPLYESTYEYLTLKNDCIDESNSNKEGKSLIIIKKALEIKDEID